jgi:hypothetical protein
MIVAPGRQPRQIKRTEVISAKSSRQPVEIGAA